MLRKEQIHKGIEQDDNIRHKKNTGRSPEHVLAEGEGIASSIDHSASTPVFTYAGQLADADSDQELADTMISLQQSHGNAYVQRVLGRLRDSQAASQSQPNPVKIESSQDSSGISISMSALVKGQKDAPHEDETPVTLSWTKKLGGLADSINPATINVNQQTIAGGTTVPAGAHGYCEVTAIGNTKVVPHNDDYEVTCTMDIKYNWEVQSLGKPSIDNANSPEVNELTWSQIVYDLTPSGDSIPRSPRELYWCSDLSGAHEQYHAVDFTSAFNSFRPAEQAWLGQQTAGNKATAMKRGDQALSRMVARVTSYMGTGDSAPCESRAYGAGVPLYEARACEVQDRADAEGWALTGEEADIMTEIREEEEPVGEATEEIVEEGWEEEEYEEEDYEVDEEEVEEEIMTEIEEEEEEGSVGGAVCEEEEPQEE